MHTWGKSQEGGSGKTGRIISAVTLIGTVIVAVLVVQKPGAMAPAQPAETVAANAHAFQAKLAELEGQNGAEVRLSGEEISAAIAQTDGTAPGSEVKPAAEETSISQPVVTFEDDVVRGQFMAQVAGKDLYVTVAGHLGAKDGYATFEPTQFKVGDLSVPVSLVNSALQKKMLEQRDRLKLPEFVSDVRVENGQLVVKGK